MLMLFIYSLVCLDIFWLIGTWLVKHTQALGIKNKTPEWIVLTVRLVFMIEVDTKNEEIVNLKNVLWYSKLLINLIIQ